MIKINQNSYFADTVGELRSRSQIAILKLSSNKMQELGIMSVNPEPIAPIPPETVRVAKAAFPKGNPYLTFRDVLGVVFGDADFAHLFSPTGQPAVPPWRLALITLMQFRENLSDRQAAESVRSRVQSKVVADSPRRSPKSPN